MLNLKPKCCVAILLMLIFIVCKGRARTLKDFESKEGNPEEKTLTKRGHSGVPNDFGPPLIISSSVLELGKEHEVAEHGGTFADEESGWEKSTISGEHLPIWNEIASGWQQPHKVLQPATAEHWPTVGLDDGVYSYDGHKAHLGLSGGLHTQIISSSGHGFSELSDKIDGSHGFDGESEHYIKSYG